LPYYHLFQPLERATALIPINIEGYAAENEAETAKLRETAKQTEERRKRAEEESARLAAEMENARERASQEASVQSLRGRRARSSRNINNVSKSFARRGE
jgi:small-conductance mechanosensitive channel